MISNLARHFKLPKMDGVVCLRDIPAFQRLGIACSRICISKRVVLNDTSDLGACNIFQEEAQSGLMRRAGAINVLILREPAHYHRSMHWKIAWDARGCPLSSIGQQGWRAQPLGVLRGLSNLAARAFCCL